MSGQRILCLGGGEGWHATQLQQASSARGCELRFATYESLAATLRDGRFHLACDAGCVTDFDAIVTRTMPAGSLEQITFRLATLHALQRETESRGPTLINPPRALELAIDKFATLELVARLGYCVPDTIVVQSRSEAIDAFDALGGDCIIKPIFGGEGRGVMRIRDAELAWYTFSTLEQLGAISYVQRFVAPGGCDSRLLVIGDTVMGVRRINPNDFRANVASGGTCEPFEPSDEYVLVARRICESIGLHFGAVDLIEDSEGAPVVIEVNAIPGWKGAQKVTSINIADRIIQLAQDLAPTAAEARCQ